MPWITHSFYNCSSFCVPFLLEMITCWRCSVHSKTVHIFRGKGLWRHLFSVCFYYCFLHVSSTDDSPINNLIFNTLSKWSVNGFKWEHSEWNALKCENSHKICRIKHMQFQGIFTKNWKLTFKIRIETNYIF